MSTHLEQIACPCCGAAADATKLAYHLRFTAHLPVYCAVCNTEISNDPVVFQALLSEMPKHKGGKRRKKKKHRLFNFNPKTMAEAERIDRATRGKDRKRHKPSVWAIPSGLPSLGKRR